MDQAVHPNNAHREQYDPWDAPFRLRIDTVLFPGMHILDVGAGRAPVLNSAQRPVGSHYAGLDLSKRELERAPTGAYDDLIVSDIAVHNPDLHERFDLIISWQVLEHVKPLSNAIANMQDYLRPDGELIAFFSGAFSVFGLVNKSLPDRVGRRVVARVMHRDPDTVFAASYDGCHPRALRRILASWSDSQITPMWGGEGYFALVPAVQRAYLRFESWAERNHYDQLATHYLVTATK